MEYWLSAHLVLWLAVLLAALATLRRVMGALKTLRNVYHYKLFPLISRTTLPVPRLTLYRTARRLIPVLGALTYSNPQFDLPPSLHLYLWLCFLTLTLIANYAVSLLLADDSLRPDVAVGIAAASTLLCLALGMSVERIFVTDLNRVNKLSEERGPELHEVAPKSMASVGRFGEVVETNNISSRRLTGVEASRPPQELTFRVPQTVEVSSDSLLSSGDTEPKTDTKNTVEILVLLILVGIVIELVWGVYVVGAREETSMKWCFLRWLVGVAVDFPVRFVVVLILGLTGLMRNYARKYVLLDFGLRGNNFKQFSKVPRHSELAMSPTAHTNLLPGSFLQEEEQVAIPTIEPLQPEDCESPQTPPPSSPRTPVIWSVSNSYREYKPGASPLQLPGSPASQHHPAVLSPTVTIKGKTPPESLHSPAASSQRDIELSPVTSPKNTPNPDSQSSVCEPQRSPSATESQISIQKEVDESSEGELIPEDVEKKESEGGNSDEEESIEVIDSFSESQNSDHFPEEDSGLKPEEAAITSSEKPQEVFLTDSEKDEEAAISDSEKPEEAAISDHEKPEEAVISDSEIKEIIETPSIDDSPQPRKIVPKRKILRQKRKKHIQSAVKPAVPRKPLPSGRLDTSISEVVETDQKPESNKAEAADSDKATDALERSERSSEPPSSMLPVFTTPKPTAKPNFEDELEPEGPDFEEEPEVVRTASSQAKNEADMETAANNTHRSSPEAEEQPVAFGDNFPVPEDEALYSDIFSSEGDRPVTKVSAESFTEPSQPYVPPTPLIRQRAKPPQPYPLRRRNPSTEDEEPSIIYPKGTVQEDGMSDSRRPQFPSSGRGENHPQASLKRISLPGSPEATDSTRMHFPLNSTGGTLPKPVANPPVQKSHYEPDVFNRPVSPTAANEDTVPFQRPDLNASGEVEVRERRKMAEEFMEVARSQGFKSEVDIDKLGEKLAARAEFHKKFGYKRTEYDSPYEELLWEMIREEPHFAHKAASGPQKQSHRVKLRTLLARYGSGSARPTGTLSRHSSLSSLGPRLRDLSSDMSRPRKKLYQMMSSQSTAALPADIINIQVPPQAIAEDPEDLSTPRREVWS